MRWPIAAAGDPKYLRANASLTMIGRSAAARSSGVKCRPATRGWPTALK
jgi:hypothetical protein